ncbi:tRNA pseudouridine synthase A, mitochondrial [Galdieria sulphuraria]|uniref:tRNA pseudouridine synthase A n=1 Tax=Galdieria sulphuraria TaxID=130081 RepID=M2XVR2_GALSU|nr:tRNA pseudouridine synthase A [Galdieria sulphuraria]EME27504.1 tRNA pseudouridine synthase A [Galdieria sulphuraria]GJD06441.1 tRNA pseudouridine synthase A, mitochondrial [Galdieria sulphuraria]|eukprot:XP_005704024.1 tRNA pseudouridine synthase A [Galdieria sulphuraria]
MGLFWSHPQVLHNDRVLKRNRALFDTTENKVPFKKSKGIENESLVTTTTKKDNLLLASAEESVSVKTSVCNSKTVAHNSNSKKRHKFAIVIGYLGAAYQGMQRNPGAVSIEGELEKALVATGLIPNNLEGNLRKIEWSRAARTDKGVSAAGQVVSTYLLVDKDFEREQDILKRVNDTLPTDIRILGVYSVSGGFHAKNACDRRRYSYMFPSWTLCRSKQEHEKMLKDSDYKNIMKAKVDDLNDLLKYFIGTHHFHNFTVGQTSSNGTCQRYILEFFCSLPFFIGGESFLNVTVVGQSFLLHQIRKMIGLAIAVSKGWIPKEAFNVSLSKHHRLETPMAPSLGLFLDECLFERYNERILKNHSDSPAVEELARIRQRAELFKRQIIYEYIACQEREHHVMERWMFLVSTKHPVDVSSIMTKHEELMNQEIILDRKRKEYMLDHISPLFDSSGIYGQHEVTLPSTLDERLNRCIEALAPKSISFYFRAPLESICIMGELTKSLKVPCVYLTSGKDIIWGISVEEGNFSITLYDSRSPSKPCYTMDRNGSLEESFVSYDYFCFGWKVANEFFQCEEIPHKKISIVFDSVHDNRCKMEIAYYCSAFFIFMKAMRPKKSLSKQEIAEILIQGMISRSLDIPSTEIYSCICSRANHLLVIRPIMETQKVAIEHFCVPQWLFEQMKWLEESAVLEENNHRQIKALWEDWLQKVHIIGALELKKSDLNWISQTKDEIPTQAHSPGMLLWKKKGSNHRVEYPERNEERHFFLDSIHEWKASPLEIANILNISWENFFSLFGEIDMEERVEWKFYLNEFINQVNSIDSFLVNWKNMVEKDDMILMEKMKLLERCLDNLRDSQKLLQLWFRKLSFSWFTATGCVQYCIQPNAIIEWKPLALVPSDWTGNDKVCEKASLHPSSGICFWYPHFVKFVRWSSNRRKVRKSARKYRLR